MGKEITSKALFVGLRIWKYINIGMFQMEGKKDLFIIISSWSVEMRKILSATFYGKNAVSRDLNDRDRRVIFSLLCL